VTGAARGAAGGAAEVDEFADEDEMPAELASDPFFAEALAERAAEEQQERRASTKAIEGGAGAVSAGVVSAGVSAGRAKEGKKRSRKEKRAPVLTEAEAAEEARKKAELELLMLGDDADDAREDRASWPDDGRLTEIAAKVLEAHADREVVAVERARDSIFARRERRAAVVRWVGQIVGWLTVGGGIVLAIQHC
jgi:hypothetical protein